MSNYKVLQHCTDQEPDLHKFRAEGVRGDIKLKQGYETEDDGVYWGMQCGTMIKGEYTQADKDHKENMKKYTPLYQGEIVIINGALYTTNIKGNYSDAIIFEPISFERDLESIVELLEDEIKRGNVGQDASIYEARNRMRRLINNLINNQ